MKHLQKTKTHDLYQVALHDRDMLPVIAYGSAGTGKTYGAIGAAVKWLDKCTGNKFVGLRPNVDAAEEIGFLPGDEREKLTPWIAPLEQNFEKHGVHKSHMESLERSGRVKFMHLGFAQGITMDNSFIFMDEVENATLKQLRMLLTRTGVNSKLVLTGDIAQVSEKFKNSGLAELLRMVDTMNMRVHTIEFTRDDIMRSQQCKDWIIAFEDWEESKTKPRAIA